MDYTELLPPLPVRGYELIYQGRHDLTKHEANAQVLKARGGHAEPLVRQSDALAAIAAAAPAIRKAERERVVALIADYPYWLGSKGKDDLITAIRALPEEPAEQGEPKCN